MPDDLLPDEVMVYPNPTDGKFQILLNKNLTGTLSINVIDEIGKKVNVISATEFLKKGLVSLDLSTLASGIYFLVMNDESGTFPTQKLLKQPSEK